MREKNETTKTFQLILKVASCIAIIQPKLKIEYPPNAILFYQELM